MAGVAGEPTMSQCPELSRHFFVRLAVSPLTLCICSIRNCMLGCDQVRSQVSAGAAMCERIHPCMDSFNVLVSASCRHKRALCSSEKSSTSGQINYQLICHYPLSKGWGGGMCLCVCASLVKWRQRNIPGPSAVFRGIPSGPGEAGRRL